MEIRCRFAIVVFAMFLALPARAQVDARMFRCPDVSTGHITFVYAGDIWVVEKSGGIARRLSSPPGEESFPRFSPDGSSIAFSGNYDGNTDVYVVPTLGGEPVRVTYHPDADRLVDWDPQGKRLLFASARESGVRRVSQLYTIPATGGVPEKLPVPYGEFGTFSPDGAHLAYTTKAAEFAPWKRYRGGFAPDIWLFDLKTKDARNLTENPALDAQPMWLGRTLYFLSDRGTEQRANIWAVDPDRGQPRQVTNFRDVDVGYPAIGPSDIVFQAGSGLHVLDLKSGKHREVKVQVVTDEASLRPRSVKVGDAIESGGISPTGKRALFEARGEIFSLPAKDGVTRNLTRTPGAAERYPGWSPDGTQVAYWSDRSGEYELTVRPADGSGEERTLSKFGPGYRYRPWWSPDGKKIAFIDHTLTIRVHDVAAGTTTDADKAVNLLHGGLIGFEMSWSPDSRWLTWSRQLEQGNSAVFVFDTDSGTRHQATSGYYSDSSPVFDPDGSYLYYFSNRTLAAVYSDLDATWIYPNTTNIVAASLRKDVASPLAPKNDEEEMKKETKKAETPAKDKPQDTEAKPKDVAFDIEGLESRAVILPPVRGNYSTLRAASGKVLYRRLPRRDSGVEESPVLYFDLKELKEETVIDSANSYELSADGKKLLVRVRDGWGIIDLKPKQKIETRLGTSALETQVDPRQEWDQVFDDVWRTYRDFFYDPSIHGLDWPALRRQYGALLKDAVTRWDVNFVIGHLIGEVNASHTYVGGGDMETPRRRQVGLLGVDWAVENGAFRIARIVRSAPWDIDARSPLSEPGVNVAAGDYVLAVNGIPLDPAREPFAAFEGLADTTVQLTINDRPALEGARKVLLKTLASEARLRNLEWIEQNRQHVDKASNGRIGYVFVPDTSINGQTELVRQFASQIRKPGLIIDERFNGGGQLPDRFIEQMNRQMVTRIAFRYAGVATHPHVAHYGPKAMLINGWAGSGGDAFPFFFKEMKVGPLIGERTWGGLIGPAVGHRLIDGGSFTAPPGRLYAPDGKWFPEGHGVDPDIAVTDDPGELSKGRDPQLDAAIREVLRMLQTNPPKFVDPPPFERRIPELQP
jgi:tricorn protease